MPSKSQIIELAAGGARDPHALHAALVLSAYFHSERVKAFRRRLWFALALVLSVWLLVATTTSLLSRSTTLAGFMVAGAAATWTAVLEWTADRKLGRLLD